jgi:hypothetical protein
MHKTLLLLLASIIVSAACAAQSNPAPAALDFPNCGFHINALDQPATTGSQIVVTMSLPATLGFAPNANVMIQYYPKTMADYIALSKSQLPSITGTIVSEKSPNANTWLVEYAGEFSGRKMHWYARAVLLNGRLYLATATALAEQWADASEKLKRCVDSLEIPATPTVSAK